MKHEVIWVYSSNFSFPELLNGKIVTWKLFFPIVAESLKVTVSRSCDRAKVFWLCTTSGDLYAQTKKFFFMFHRYYVILVRFLHKISRLNFWPHKKSSLECLHCNSSTFHRSAETAVYKKSKVVPKENSSTKTTSAAT